MTAILEKEKMKKANPELLEKVKKYLETSDVDQTTLAKRLGKSSTVISLYLNDKYNGDIEAFENDLRKYLHLSESKKKHKKLKLEFEMTAAAADIIKLAKSTQYNGEIAICYGISGLGKTTALEYMKKHGSGIILVDPDENASPRAIMKQIADSLKLDYDMLMEDFIANIVKKLKKSGYLIVVDEAENLKPDVFRTLRKIHDRCETTCGMLFVGTERLKNNLLKRKGEFKYVLNRVACVVELNPLTLNDIRPFVKQVFPDAPENIVNLFSSITKNNARVLFNLFKRCKSIMEANNSDLDEGVIFTARGLLF